jgi:hypothetical protein
MPLKILNQFNIPLNELNQHGIQFEYYSNELNHKINLNDRLEGLYGII